MLHRWALLRLHVQTMKAVNNEVSIKSLNQPNIRSFDCLWLIGKEIYHVIE